MKFDRVIPGESLTAAPGNFAYEKPPQFVDPDKAMEFLVQSLLKPKSLLKLQMLLEAGVPVEGFVRVILFSGFAEGKWTYDLVVLLTRPLATFIGVLAKSIGIKKFKMTAQEGKVPKDLADMEQQVKKMKALEKPEEEAAAAAPAPTNEMPKTGLMGMM